MNKEKFVLIVKMVSLYGTLLSMKISPKNSKDLIIFVKPVNTTVKNAPTIKLKLVLNVTKVTTC